MFHNIGGLIVHQLITLSKLRTTGESLSRVRTEYESTKVNPIWIDLPVVQNEAAMFVHHVDALIRPRKT